MPEIMPETNYKPHPFLISLLMLFIFAAVASGVYLLLPNTQTTTSTPKAVINIPSIPSSTLKSSAPAAVAPVDKTTTISASIIILDKTYKIFIKPGASAYDAMKLLLDQGSITFTAKEYQGMGYFIESINGLKNDDKSGKYWFYYVNGESGKIGVSNYIIKPADIIKWTYAKSNF